jgi:chromate reductase
MIAPDYKVAVLVGSLRKASINRKVADALAKLSPPGFSFIHLQLGDLPLYNADLEDEGVPETWSRLRAAVAGCDAVLFVTPEYNRSVPAVLKNALDIGSRPPGQNVWKGKPAGVVSVTPGAMGGFGANHALRQSLVFLDMPTLQQPEAYVGHAAELIDDQDEVVVEATREFLRGFMIAFTTWVSRLDRSASDGA